MKIKNHFKLNNSYHATKFRVQFYYTWSKSHVPRQIHRHRSILHNIFVLVPPVCLYINDEFQLLFLFVHLHIQYWPVRSVVKNNFILPLFGRLVITRFTGQPKRIPNWATFLTPKYLWPPSSDGYLVNASLLCA